MNIFILRLIPATTTLYNEQQQIVMIDRRAAPCLLPRQWRPWSSYLCLWRGIGDKDNWVSWSCCTCQRYEDNRVPFPSRLMGGTGPLASPCSHTTLGRECAYIHAFLYTYVLCVGVEWLRDRKGPERRPFWEERVGKEPNRDCPELMIHKPPSLQIHTAFWCKSQHFKIFTQWMGVIGHWDFI